MIFTSMNPMYLDPLNGSKQHVIFDNQVQEGHNIGEGDEKPHVYPTPARPQPPLAPPSRSGEDGIGGIRTVSTAERARLAKIPQPEGGLACPRCESTNTKFCYFNNYSLSQPRHFCKTCRRYWTRGGALRNVPVGGGCRRSNKRSKGSNASIRSKSPLLKGNMLLPPLNLPMLPPLHDLGEYNSTNDALVSGGIRPPTTLTPGGAGVLCGAGFQFGNINSTATTTTTSSGLIEQWRLQQQQQVPEFPFLANFEAQNNQGLYSFEAINVGHERGNYVDQIGLTSSSKQLESQLRAVNQYWSSTSSTTTTTNNIDNGINSWIDLPSFTTSSTSQML